MRRWLSLFGSVVAGVTLFVACSSSDGTATPSPNGAGDASTTNGDASGSESDSSTPIEEEGGTTALTPTKKTSLVATIQSVKRTLTRAQYGDSKPDGGGDATLYIEAHEGGSPECPDSSSPTPERTVIISGVPRGKAGTKYTKKDDGIAVSFLDFTGDQLPSKPVTKATSATVTIVAIDSSVELEVEATFAEGTVKGRVYAAFCFSLSN